MGLLKNIGFVSLTTVLSIVVLFLLTKLMGAKQVSQMTMFDYVEGLPSDPWRRNWPRIWTHR